VGTAERFDLMSSFNKLAVLQSLENWKQYKEELAFELTKEKSAYAVGLEFPKDPKKYPCLVAALAPSFNSLDSSILTFPRVTCCFVYPEDAARLLDVVQANDPNFRPVVDGDGPTESLEDEITLLSTAGNPDKAKDADYEYKPSHVGILVLSLIMEMRAIGALKPEKFVQTVNKIERWLIDHMDDNKNKGPIDVLNRLWSDNSLE
jgi:hypothetical protein